MLTSFLTPFFVATVVLVPRPGSDAIPKKKVIVEQASIDEEESLDIVLRPQDSKAEAKRKTKSNKKKHKLQRTAQNREINTIETEPLLQRVEKKYKTGFVKVKLEKEVTQAILETTKTYKGQMALGPSGLLKMDIETPQKSSLVVDGKNIWVIDYPVDEARNKVQILHAKVQKKKGNQAFLGDLLSGSGLLKNFKVESQAEKKDETTYRLVPNKKDSDIQRIELNVATHDELITSLSYWDQMGNKTELRFSKQEFEDKTPENYFQYQPPAGADITEM